MRDFSLSLVPYLRAFFILEIIKILKTLRTMLYREFKKSRRTWVVLGPPKNGDSAFNEIGL
jgi:hypothetical protein